jgi:hypothetical protein
MTERRPVDVLVPITDELAADELTWAEADRIALHTARKLYAEAGRELLVDELLITSRALATTDATVTAWDPDANAFVEVPMPPALRYRITPKEPTP